MFSIPFKERSGLSCHVESTGPGRSAPAPGKAGPQGSPITAPGPAAPGLGQPPVSALRSRLALRPALRAGNSCTPGSYPCGRAGRAGRTRLTPAGSCLVPVSPSLLHHLGKKAAGARGGAGVKLLNAQRPQGPGSESPAGGAPHPAPLGSEGLASRVGHPGKLKCFTAAPDSGGVTS